MYIANLKSCTFIKWSLESSPSSLLWNLDISVPHLDFIISIQYSINITDMPINLWFQQIILKLVCTSNTFDIMFISFSWVINRWASKELGCEMQFLKSVFKHRWCMCFVLMFTVLIVSEHTFLLGSHNI